MIVNRRTATAWANGNRNDVDQPGICKQKRIFRGCGLKNCCLAVNLPLKAKAQLGGAELEFVAFRLARVFCGQRRQKPLDSAVISLRCTDCSVVLIRVQRAPTARRFYFTEPAVLLIYIHHIPSWPALANAPLGRRLPSIFTTLLYLLFFGRSDYAPWASIPSPPGCHRRLGWQ
jgi:hypothetical protein